jgi:type II secretory pathway predicted ATPase ExeA
MLVQGTDTIILVIGESGSGKTTLLKRYLTTTDSEWESYRIRTHPATVRQNRTSKGRSHYPAYVLKKTGDPVIIMDNAHAISRKNLQFLLRKTLTPGGINGCRRLILFGKTELVKTISNLVSSVSQKIAVNKIFLSPLTVEDTTAYLRHRLAMAGYSGQNLFTPQIVKRIHKKSDGLPGRINQNARRWLEKNYKKAGKSKTGSTPSKSRLKVLMIGSAAACLVLVTAFIYLFNPPKKSIITVPITSQPAKIITVKINDNRVALKQISGIQNPPIPEKTIKPSPTVAVQKEVENKPLTPLQADTAPKTPLPERTTAVSEAEPEKKIAAVRQPEPTQRPPVAPQVEKPEIAETSILVITNAPDEKIKRENWLQARNPSQYTIQVIGVRSETTLLRFIAENSSALSNRQLAYYRSAFKSEDWFPLLYGVYESRKDARLARDGLPENIRKHSPWIRTLSAVQNDINRRKNP